MSKPRLLDLFCKAGGCTRGYQLAGFEVTGVDIAPQPNYCGDAFIQADALDVLRCLVNAGGSWDFIHASPPCQAFTVAQVIHGRDHLDLLTPSRDLMKATGVPWVIENVPGAPMTPHLVLCGSMFGLEDEAGMLKRHRWFEFSDGQYRFPPSGCRHDRTTISVFGHGGHVYHGVEQWRSVMGIDWMSRDELAQAIPPAYTEWIGTQLLSVLEEAP